MLQRIVAFSIRFRGVTLALACVAVGYGLYIAAHAKFDVFPEFAPPQVILRTEAPGLSPEEVEALVTRPIENAVNGVGNLESIRSQSIQGLSVVTAIFREGTEIFQARQMVGERLVEASGQMPQGVHPPTMAPLAPATSVVLAVGLTSERRSPMELGTFADWTVRPRQLGVPGVAKVAVFGGEVRQLQIQGRPGVILVVSGQFGANTREITLAVEQALGEMRLAFRAEGIVVHPALFRPANFIETAIHNVNRSLLLGGILVAAILFLFLFNLRTAFISLTAIPLSLLISVILLDRFGATLNTITLGGLAIAGVGIVLLLAIAFGRLRNLLLVLANLPFALVGGVLAVFFSGGWLSLGSLVGFVTLFEISTRNSIMMVSHFEHLVAVEGMAWGLEATLRGAQERLAPILMTALVTALGLLPLALGSGEPGREVEGPMALVILGGLTTSTALNLLVLPTLALRYGRFEPPPAEREPAALARSETYSDFKSQNTQEK